MLRWEPVFEPPPLPTRREKLECLVTIAFIVAATVNVFIFISNPDVVFGAIATVITMMFWAWVLEGRLGPLLD